MTTYSERTVEATALAKLHPDLPGDALEGALRRLTRPDGATDGTRETRGTCPLRVAAQDGRPRGNRR